MTTLIRYAKLSLWVLSRSKPRRLLSWCDHSRLLGNFPSSGKLIWQTTLRRSGICENVNPYRWKAMRTLSNYRQWRKAEGKIAGRALRQTTIGALSPPVARYVFRASLCKSKSSASSTNVAQPKQNVSCSSLVLAPTRCLFIGFIHPLPESNLNNPRQLLLRYVSLDPLFYLSSASHPFLPRHGW